MKKNRLLIFLLFLIISIAFNNQEILAAEEPSSDVALNMELTTPQKYQNVYLTSDQLDGVYYINSPYTFTGTQYDASHEYVASVSFCAANITASINEETNLFEFTAMQKGNYEVEMVIFDVTSSEHYYQTIYIYVCKAQDYYIFITGGKYLESGELIPVTFERPYGIDDGTIEYARSQFTDIGLELKLYIDIDFEIVLFNQDLTIEDYQLYSKNSYTTETKDGLKFTITWPTMSSLLNMLEEYVVYLRISDGETTTTKRSNFNLTRNYDRGNNNTINFDVIYDPNYYPGNAAALNVPNQYAQYFFYEYFILLDERTFTVDDFLYETKFQTLFNKEGFYFKGPNDTAVDIYELANSIGLDQVVGGAYYIYVIAKDVSGLAVGIECVTSTIPYTEEETAAFVQTSGVIDNLINSLEGIDVINYPNFSNIFSNVEAELAKIPANQYHNIENYKEYLELVEKCENAKKVNEVNEQLKVINEYEIAQYVEHDLDIVKVYEEYNNLSSDYLKYIDYFDCMNSVRRYMENRTYVKDFSDLANNFISHTTSSKKEAQQLLQQYENLTAVEKAYLTEETLNVIYEAKALLEGNITSISLDCGDQMNLLLNADSEYYYTLSTTKEFIDSGLKCEWLVSGDAIFDYEMTENSLIMYPHQVGQCQVIVYYKTLEGQILTDQVTIVVLEDEIEAFITITKDTEGAYTTYDTLNFSFQLSYDLPLGEDTQYIWSIDSTVVSNTATFSHRFLEAKSYVIECEIIDENIGIDSIKTTRQIAITNVTDADFTLSINYPDKIYAYLHGNVIIVDAYLDGYLNYDYTYNWSILDQSILTFNLQTNNNPQIVLTPLKGGTTSVIVMVDVGKYQPKTLMYSLEIEVIEEVKSIELYREESDLKPGSTIRYRASINNLSNVVNLEFDFSIDASIDDEVIIEKVADNEIILRNLKKGKYEVNAKVDNVSTSEEFKIQTVALDQILLSILPIFIIVACALIIFRMIYNHRKSKLVSVLENVLAIDQEIKEFREKIMVNEKKQNLQKLVIKKLKRWKNKLAALNVTTTNLSIQENMELEMASKYLTDISFILEAGIKTFKIKFYEQTVFTYLDKISSNNIAELIKFYEQKINTMNIQLAKQKEDDLLKINSVEAKKEKEKHLTPKEYADYLRKINYYDAEDSDQDN